MSQAGFQGVMQALNNLGVTFRQLGQDEEARRERKADKVFRQDQVDQKKIQDEADTKYRNDLLNMNKAAKAEDDRRQAAALRQSKLQDILGNVNRQYMLANQDPTQDKNQYYKQIGKIIDAGIGQLGASTAEANYLRSFDPLFMSQQEQAAAQQQEPQQPELTPGPQVPGPIGDLLMGSGLKSYGQEVGDTLYNYSQLPGLNLIGNPVNQMLSNVPMSAINAVENASQYLIPENVMQAGAQGVLAPVGAGIGGAIAGRAAPLASKAIPSILQWLNPAIGRAVGQVGGAAAGGLLPTVGPDIKRDR